MLFEICMTNTRETCINNCCIFINRLTPKSEVSHSLNFLKKIDMHTTTSIILLDLKKLLSLRVLLQVLITNECTGFVTRYITHSRIEPIKLWFLPFSCIIRGQCRCYVHPRRSCRTAQYFYDAATGVSESLESSSHVDSLWPAASSIQFCTHTLGHCFYSVFRSI